MKFIEIVGAKRNNLKSIHLKIPLNSFTVICGPSGSGKSSLAFSTLFAEGYRQYTQTLSNYTKQFIGQYPAPMVKKITNLPPALALEQNNKVRSARPIVATFVSLSDLLRLLFTGLGKVECPKHKKALAIHSPTQASKFLAEHFKNDKGFILTPLAQTHPDLKKLIKEGFSYLLKIKSLKTKLTFQILDIRLLKKWPKGDIYLVIDRVAFKDKSRVLDSLKAAFKWSKLWHQKAFTFVRVLSTQGISFYFSSELALCNICAYTFPFTIRNALFNFNSSLGACPSCKGFGCHLLLDENKIVPSPWKTLAEGAIQPFTLPSTVSLQRKLIPFCKKHRIQRHIPWEKLAPPLKKKIWDGDGHFIGIKGFFEYLEKKKYKMPVRVFLSRYKSSKICPVCRGTRFRKELSYITFREKTFPELLSMDVETLTLFFKSIQFSSIEKRKLQIVIKKIHFLLEMLNTIGLSYLSLNRTVKSLSSGELQRLSLVHQLGIELSQTLYVLDEPTVGLHASDTKNLITLLTKLNQLGNTLVVVEHDPYLIKTADYIVELGPKAGIKGGNVVFSGSSGAFLSNKKSSTSAYLNLKNHQKPKVGGCHPVASLKDYKYFLEITGCSSYNLKNIRFRLPLNRLVCVTGISGSGKSTLVTKTLYPAVARALGKKSFVGKTYAGLKGQSFLKDVVLVPATVTEKTKRSLPVTYLKIYDSIRALMAEVSLRKAKDFSLNVEGGRCPVCRGLGFREIEMVFMEPVRITCGQCGGERFQNNILQIKYKNKNIHQILSMTVQQALEFFIAKPELWRALSLLKKVGMEYLVLGQSLSSLSGGELQRLKLVRELLHGKKTSTLYILDEPTVGLSFKEVFMLLSVLQNLVDKGNSVLLIEHNMELISRADYIVDMGPGAGRHGGNIVFEGTAIQLARFQKSRTGRVLKEFL